QDNDPKYMSKLSKEWLEENNVKVLPWPANSPDMSLTEHALGKLERHVRQHGCQPSLQEELWQILQEESKDCKTLYEGPIRSAISQGMVYQVQKQTRKRNRPRSKTCDIFACRAPLDPGIFL
ncbi:hypothetical protein BT96DRAFT_834663, partial [Gymnopus androsaceus JB14]